MRPAEVDVATAVYWLEGVRRRHLGMASVQPTPSTRMLSTGSAGAKTPSATPLLRSDGGTQQSPIFLAGYVHLAQILVCYGTDLMKSRAKRYCADGIFFRIFGRFTWQLIYYPLTHGRGLSVLQNSDDCS